MEDFLKLVAEVEAAAVAEFGRDYIVLVTTHSHTAAGDVLRGISVSLHSLTQQPGAMMASEHDVCDVPSMIDALRADLDSRKAAARAKLRAIAGEP